MELTVMYFYLLLWKNDFFYLSSFKFFGFLRWQIIFTIPIIMKQITFFLGISVFKLEWLDK